MSQETVINLRSYKSSPAQGLPYQGMAGTSSWQPLPSSLLWWELGQDDRWWTVEEMPSSLSAVHPDDYEFSILPNLFSSSSMVLSNKFSKLFTLRPSVLNMQWFIHPARVGEMGWGWDTGDSPPKACPRWVCNGIGVSLSHFRHWGQERGWEERRQGWEA